MMPAVRLPEPKLTAEQSITQPTGWRAEPQTAAQIQRKSFGHITTLEAFREEYPHVGPHSVALARFRAQLGTRNASLDANGRLVGGR